MKKTVMVLFLLWYILGCAHTIATKSPGMDFAPTSEVNLLETIPERPHKQIGVIESNFNPSYGDSVERIKQEGKAMGADALIIINKTMTGGGLFGITALAIKYQGTPSQTSDKW